MAIRNAVYDPKMAKNPRPRPSQMKLYLSLTCAIIIGANEVYAQETYCDAVRWGLSVEEIKIALLSNTQFEYALLFRSHQQKELKWSTSLRNQK